MTRQEEIKLICRRLYVLWKRHPKLRFGQVILVLSANKEGKELYDFTDNQILKEIEKEIEKENE